MSKVGGSGSIVSSLSLTASYYASQLDDDALGTMYVGIAEPGTATSAAAWQIKKVVETGVDIAVTWADGNANFDNVWADRASLTYS